MLTLVILNNSTRSYVHHLDGKSPELVGRFAPRLHVDDENAQRKHAELRLESGKWIIEDLGLRYGENRNGVYVNGQLIGHTVTLNRGDQIRIGECQMVVADITCEQAGMPLFKPGTVDEVPASPSSEHVACEPGNSLNNPTDIQAKQPEDSAQDDNLGEDDDIEVLQTTEVSDAPVDIIPPDECDDQVELNRIISAAVDFRAQAAIQSAAEAAAIKAATIAAKQTEDAAREVSASRLKDAKAQAIAKALAKAAEKAKAAGWNKVEEPVDDDAEVKSNQNNLHLEESDEANAAHEISDAMKWWSNVQSTTRPASSSRRNVKRKGRNGGKWRLIMVIMLLISATIIVYNLKDHYAGMEAAISQLTTRKQNGGYGRISIHNENSEKHDEIEIIVKDEKVAISRRHQPDTARSPRSSEQSSSMSNASSTVQFDNGDHANQTMQSPAFSDAESINRDRHETVPPLRRWQRAANKGSPARQSASSDAAEPSRVNMNAKTDSLKNHHRRKYATTTAMVGMRSTNSPTNRNAGYSAINTAVTNLKRNLTTPPTKEIRQFLQPLFAEPMALTKPTEGNIVYLVDASGSLIDSLPDVIHWLTESIEMLSGSQKFTIIFFRDGEIIEVPPYGMKPINDQYKLPFNEWMSQPAGNIYAERGSEPYLAIQLALRYGAGEIFILSDDFAGYQANWGSDEQVLFGIQALLQNRPVRIHTVQFYYRDPGGLLERIAEEHGGKYQFVIPQWGPSDLFLVDPFDEL